MTRFGSMLIVVTLFVVPAVVNAKWTDPRDALSRGLSREEAQRSLASHCAHLRAGADMDHRERLADIERGLSGPGTKQMSANGLRRIEEKRRAKEIAAIDAACRQWKAEIETIYAADLKRSSAPRQTSGDVENLLRRQRAECDQRKKRVLSDYEAARLRLTRSLGSLDRPTWQKQTELNAERQRRDERLREIENECRKAARDLKTFADRQPKRVPASVESRDPGKAGLPMDLAFSGRFSQEIAQRLQEPRDVSVLRTRLLLQQTFAPSAAVRFKFSQSGWYDAAYEVTDNYPDAVEDDLESEFELREAFMDLSLGSAEIRIGRQQVVWGEAIGVFVADVVNARDLREFLLPDFNLIRIPQWGVDVGLYLGDVHVELLGLLPEMNRLPKPGAEFSVAPPPGGPAADPTSAVKPARNLDNGEYASRVSWLVSGWDFSGFALYGWNKTPVFERTASQPTELTPVYTRQPSFGGSFSKEAVGTVFRGEFVAHPALRLQDTDPVNPEGFSRRDTWEAASGVDRTLPGGLEASVQYGIRLIRDFRPTFAGERAARRWGSLFLRRPFLQGKIQPEYLLVADLDRTDRMHRPKISFQLSGAVVLAIGADLFAGETSNGFFGAFDENDRGVVTLSCSF